MRSTCSSRGDNASSADGAALRFQVALLNPRQQAVGNLRAKVRAAAGNHAQGFQQIRIRRFFQI